MEALKEAITKLKRKVPTYTPLRTDPTDMALGKYLNQISMTLEVPFTQEERDIYIFGTKRLFIKKEKGKIVCRVGGGYMKLEEFIEVYTPLELDK